MLASLPIPDIPAHDKESALFAALSAALSAATDWEQSARLRARDTALMTSGHQKIEIKSERTVMPKEETQSPSVVISRLFITF